MSNSNETQDKYYVPLWHKSNLTVEEAETYSRDCKSENKKYYFGFNGDAFVLHKI